MNRDSAINMAQLIDKISRKKCNFVLISAAKSPPFLADYLITKEEAEKYIIN